MCVPYHRTLFCDIKGSWHICILSQSFMGLFTQMSHEPGIGKEHVKPGKSFEVLHLLYRLFFPILCAFGHTGLAHWSGQFDLSLTFPEGAGVSPPIAHPLHIVTSESHARCLDFLGVPSTFNSCLSELHYNASMALCYRSQGGGATPRHLTFCLQIS